METHVDRLERIIENLSSVRRDLFHLADDECTLCQIGYAEALGKANEELFEVKVRLLTARSEYDLVNRG